MSTVTPLDAELIDVLVIFNAQAKIDEMNGGIPDGSNLAACLMLIKQTILDHVIGSDEDDASADPDTESYVIYKRNALRAEQREALGHE